MERLQDDLRTLEDWSDKWLLLFHPGKCEVLTIGSWWHQRNGAYPYELLGTQLEHVPEVKDLGVTIDEGLTFQPHIEIKLAKANQMLGLIRRSFSCCSGNIVLPLYKAFVRHHLEYGVVVWGGFMNLKQVKAIEKVQLHALDMVEGLECMQYTEQLSALKLPTLAFRRLRGLAIEVWKHFNSYDNQVISASFERSRSPRHPLALRPSSSTKRKQKRSFYHRAPAVWNDLPLSVREAENINTFKNRLDAWWRDHPLRHDYLACPTDEADQEYEDEDGDSDRP